MIKRKEHTTYGYFRFVNEENYFEMLNSQCKSNSIANMLLSYRKGIIMKMKAQMKQLIKGVAVHVPYVRNVIPNRRLYRKYSRVQPYEGFGKFLQEHADQLYSTPLYKSKAEQIADLLCHVDICPVDYDGFF